MRETLEQMIARANAGGFVPTQDPTAFEGVKVMAQKIKMPKNKEFHFQPAGKTTPSKYPWDEWFNGDLLLLERSEGTEDDKGTVVDVTEKKDFEVSVDSMPAKIKTAARRRYKVVQISRRDADGNKLDNALIIRARDMTADERTAEDLLRAEEKEAMRAKRGKGQAEANGQPAGTSATDDHPETD